MSDNTRKALVAGASSGFGAMISRALADAGTTVYAGMRDTSGRNAGCRRPVRQAVTEGSSSERVSSPASRSWGTPNASSVSCTAAGRSRPELRWGK